MFVKKTIATTVLICATAFPLIGYAELVIHNETNQFSTSIINHGSCSTDILGDDGVTPPNTTKTIPDWQINIACYPDYENCIADVYMTNNCSGKLITTVTFSATTGIKNATKPVDGYDIKYSGFSVTLSGGPPAKKK